MDYKLDDLNFSNKTLAQQVYEKMRMMILRQYLTPGERIDQNNLAEQLEVSLGPVREALKTLETEGLVKIIPRRGAFVTEVSPDHLSDLYLARQLIEGEAAFHALEQFTDEDIEHLCHLNQGMRRATEQKNIYQFMQLNREFHMTIYRRAGSQHLLAVLSQLWDRSEIYRYRYAYVLKNAENAHKDHESIISACEQRNSAQIKQLIIAHIQHTLVGLHKVIADQLESSDSSD